MALDSYGDPIAEDELQPHPIDCTGWAGEDVLGHPIPCAVCRSETAERIARQRRRDWEGPAR